MLKESIHKQNVGIQCTVVSKEDSFGKNCLKVIANVFSGES